MRSEPGCWPGHGGGYFYTKRSQHKGTERIRIKVIKSDPLARVEDLRFRHRLRVVPRRVSNPVVVMESDCNRIQLCLLNEQEMDCIGYLCAIRFSRTTHSLSNRTYPRHENNFSVRTRNGLKGNPPPNCILSASELEARFQPTEG